MSTTPSPANGTKEESAGLGTFAGVFTPSILTILGIILFLRLGFVVGNAGLGRALVVIALANVISVLTTVSLSAIATNFKVKGGGDYYLISRSLGPEFGGAIGIILFLAQSVSVAFYAIGFAEGVTAMFPDLSPRLVAGAALFPLFALSWLGSDWATRFQYVIMFVLTLAIGVFMIGAASEFSIETLSSNWSASGDLTFWAIFALFFPAVTGFTQGVSMSGELKDPARSLPSGTFAAVGVSIVVYFLGAVLFAGSMPGPDLISDYGAMGRIALIPGLITAGIFAATLSSALASFLGAPRILHALATDRLFPILKPFAKADAATGNPRRAVLLCFAIAAFTVAVGDLNVVAPVVSMFFLISYGLLNYATFFEASSGSPSFRPTFKWFRPRASLLGCLACGGTMLAIDALAGAIAIAAVVAVHQYLARSGGPDRWADASRSALFQRVRSSLRSMSGIVEHDRDWRPVVLAFSDDPSRRTSLLRFASWIADSSGITTAVKLVKGEGALARRESSKYEQELRAELETNELNAFVRVLSSEDLMSAYSVLLQASGLGPIRPNIALLNWFDREETAEDAPAMKSYGAVLRTSLRHGCNVILLAGRAEALDPLGVPDERVAPARQIDIWWHSDASSKLALLLAHLMSRSELWSGAKLRVLSDRGPGQSDTEAIEALRAVLAEVRIDADVVLVRDVNWSTVAEASAPTSLAFVTFRIGAEGLLDASGSPVPSSLEGLPPMALVQAAEDLELDAQPDEGTQAEVAQVRDQIEDTEKRAKKLREEAETLREEAETLRESARVAAERAAEVRESESAAESSTVAEKEAKSIEADAASLERKAAKAEAKAIDLHKELE